MELQRTMTQSEFSDWVLFYQAFPFDDFHRYHRPAALISKSMDGGSISDKLDFLQPPAWHADFDDADLKTIKAFGLTK